jgi:hypothetical protein
MKEAGLRVAAYGVSAKEDDRNIVIGGSRNDPTIHNKLRMNPCCEEYVPAFLANPIDLLKEEGRVLTDDRGDVEWFNAEYHEQARLRVLRELPHGLMVEE